MLPHRLALRSRERRMGSPNTRLKVARLPSASGHTKLTSAAHTHNQQQHVSICSHLPGDLALQSTTEITCMPDFVC